MLTKMHAGIGKGRERIDLRRGGVPRLGRVSPISTSKQTSRLAEPSAAVAVSPLLAEGPW
jgi:hypothetical protein